MVEELRELWRYRELLLVMTQRELRIRYKNSVLGVLWSFVNPLLTMLVMWLVFGKLLNNEVDNFSAYLLAALLPFTFFSQAVLDSAQSVLAALPIVRKVYFPRELLPLSIILGNFVHLLTGFVVFFLFLFGVYAWSGFRESPFQATTWMLPGLMLITFCLATGVGLLVSALNTFYEDVKYVATAVLYLLTYLCPIVYFHETIAQTLRGHVWLYRLYMANPLATLTVAYRKILLAPTAITMPGRAAKVQATEIPWNWLALATLVSVATLVWGYHAFNRAKWRFVERP